jgi:two-component system, OmpR family, alkaline phosphatase synthesis response regulator PhoP
MTEKFHLLVIEDEVHIAEGVKLHMELNGYQVSIAVDGQEGLKLWAEIKPDLIILDIMMPKVDGLRVLELIRRRDERLPILILSARDSAQDKIKALANGVDDYLSKPFDANELVLRVDRLLLRSGWYREQNLSPSGRSLELEKRSEKAQNDILLLGQKSIDLNTGLITSSDKELQLTEQELKLLRVFVLYKDVPMSRKDLLSLAWDYPESMETRTLDNFIVRLRKYFEVDQRKPRYFKSVRSLGYVFESSD